MLLAVLTAVVAAVKGFVVEVVGFLVWWLLY
jgi:hypothetical protein